MNPGPRSSTLTALGALLTVLVAGPAQAFSLDPEAPVETPFDLTAFESGIADPFAAAEVTSIVIVCAVDGVCTSFVDGLLLGGAPRCNSAGYWQGDAQYGGSGTLHAEMEMRCGGDRITGCYGGYYCIAGKVRSKGGVADCDIAPGNSGTCAWSSK